ncbi:hypothetical protein KEM56_007012 [Ascosphaera pollenicola]|nr:hypothetical protein KEM56_007012 [Ascosphaera pollenicola]
MSITHIVMFRFKSDLSAADVHDHGSFTASKLLALKDECLHPKTQTPYILSVTGGKDNSSEGIQHGITHAFVVQFANAEDRDYYCTTDPAHMKFVKNLQGKVEKAQAVDYEAGKF